MKKQLIALSLLLCFLAFTATSIYTAKAQTYAPGVQPGQDYQYNTYSYWTSSNAYDSIPQDLVATNQTQYIEVRISDANDTFVTTFTATYYYNANPDAARGSVNVLTGDVTDGGFPAIIAANLTAGQLIHPGASDGITINSTGTMAGRPTNEINISDYNTTSGVTSSADRYFDQATGMLLQEIDRTADDGSVSGTTSVSQVTTVLQYSPWNPAPSPSPTTVPEFSPILALPIFIGATTLIVIALKKKHLIVGNPTIKA